MLIKYCLSGLVFLVLLGQAQAAENSRYKNQTDGRNNVSKKTANENKIPTPSEMEKFSRTEIKKKLEGFDAERKRSSGH